MKVYREEFLVIKMTVSQGETLLAALRRLYGIALNPLDNTSTIPKDITDLIERLSEDLEYQYEEEDLFS